MAQLGGTGRLLQGDGRTDFWGRSSSSAGTSWLGSSPLLLLHLSLKRPRRSRKGRGRDPVPGLWCGAQSCCSSPAAGRLRTADTQSTRLQGRGFIGQRSGRSEILIWTPPIRFLLTCLDASADQAHRLPGCGGPAVGQHGEGAGGRLGVGGNLREKPPTTSSRTRTRAAGSVPLCKSLSLPVAD